jgi:predicted transcriptional regulator
MTLASRPLVLSLRPRFADAILNGGKTAELRRQRVNAPPGTPVILYSSSPVMAVVGTARIAAIQTSPPDQAWRQYWRHLGLTRDEFNTYLDGSGIACVLELTTVQTLDSPLPLHQLRQTATFRPPQSYRYLSAHDPAALRELSALRPSQGAAIPSTP